ncbi:MAG: nitrate reductase associated protein [Bacteroidota bacterium]|nr:nitrate reductase associated protein [Bacteroidota bacterium]
MKVQLTVKDVISPSPFRSLAGIEYFDFEEEFMESNMRCIPMIVRFKMDNAGIKLKLSEWSALNQQERFALALKSCSSEDEIKDYHDYLAALVRKYTGKEPTLIPAGKEPLADNWERIPEELAEKAGSFHCVIPGEKWQQLTILQRYALLKLCRPGHENKNFPKAMKEFGVLGTAPIFMNGHDGHYKPDERIV